MPPGIERRERRWKIAGLVFGVLVPLGCFVVNHYLKVIPWDRASGAVTFKGAVGLSMMAMLVCLWQSGRSTSLVFLLGPPMFLGMLLATALTYFLGVLGAMALLSGIPLGLFGLCPPLTLVVFTRWWWVLMKTRKPVTAGVVTSIGVAVALVLLSAVVAAQATR